jgi:hypothetical protein
LRGPRAGRQRRSRTPERPKRPTFGEPTAARRQMGAGRAGHRLGQGLGIAGPVHSWRGTLRRESNTRITPTIARASVASWPFPRSGKGLARVAGQTSVKRTSGATFDPIAGSGGNVLVTGSTFGLVSPKVGPAAREPEGRHDATSREHSRTRPRGARRRALGGSGDRPVARALRQGGGQVTIARRARESRCAPGL